MSSPEAMELVDGLADLPPEPPRKVEPRDELELQEEEQKQQHARYRVDEEEIAEQADEVDVDVGGEVDEVADDGEEGEDSGALDASEAARRRQRELKRRKRLHANYKAISDTMDDAKNQAKLSDPMDNAFSFYVDVTEKLNSKIGAKDVTSSLRDADVHTRLAGFGLAQARKLTSIAHMSSQEVKHKLLAQHGVRDEDAAASVEGQERQSIGLHWHRLGRLVAHKFAAITPTSFMKGVLGLQLAGKAAKKRSQKKAADEDDDEPVARASQNHKPGEEEATMTDGRVTALWEALPIEPTCLFTVLFHPRSFTQTIENLFDLTFLIRKGQAAMTLDSELGTPLVCKIDTELQGMDAAAPVEQRTFQTIFKLSMAEYQEILTAFKLKHRPPWLPDRTQQYERAGDGESEGAAPARGRGHGAAAAAAASSSTSIAARRPGSSSRSVASSSTANFFSPSQPTLNAFAERAPNSGGRKRRIAAAALSYAEEEGEASDAAADEPAERSGDDGD
jgi:hypothetical protein